MKKTNLFAGLVGNALEWYDFLLYAYFASILAPLFFPSTNPIFSLLLTFSVFAIGFIARPLGAMVIGRVGDLYGRKKALIFSISIMSISTFVMGVLPTYATLGVLAPILLTLIRCLQGFAVAGEIGTTAAYLVEHAPSDRRGYMGSFVMATSYLGIFIGVVVVTLITAIIPIHLLVDWGWRIPFLLALPWGMAGLLLRLRAVESPHFAEMNKKTKNKETSLKQIFCQYPKVILLAMGFVAFSATAEYFFIGYFTNYLASPGSHLTLKDAMVINMISIFLFLFFLPFFGACSDRMGRKKVFLASMLGLIVSILPIFWLIEHKTFYYALSGEILFTFFLAGMDGVVLTLLAESFPTEIRNTALTVTYNLSLAIFGGTAPFIAIMLVELTHYNYAPALYGMVIGIMAFICLSFFKETFRETM